MFDREKYNYPAVPKYDKYGFHIYAKEFCNVFCLLADEVEQISKDKASFFRKIADDLDEVGVYSFILEKIKKTGVYIWNEQKILEVRTPNCVLVSCQYDRITVDNTADGKHVIIRAYFDNKSKIYHEVANIEEVQYTEQVTQQKLKVSAGLLTEINKLDLE